MTPVAPDPALTKPRVWPVFVAYAGIWSVLGTLSVVLLFAVLVPRLIESPEALESEGALEALLLGALTHPWTLAVNMVFSSLTLLLTGLLAGHLSPIGTTDRLRVDRRPAGVGYAALLCLTTICLGGTFSSAADLLGWNRGSALELINTATQAAPPAAFAVLLSFGTLAGLGEELFCRGYMQTRLIQRWGRWPGIAVTAALFGILHVDPLHSTFAFFVGLLLGWAADARGSIVAAIVAHAVNNFWAFIASRANVSATSVEGKLTTLAVSIALMSLGLFLLWRHHRRRPNPKPS